VQLVVLLVSSHKSYQGIPECNKAYFILVPFPFCTSPKNCYWHMVYTDFNWVTAFYSTSRKFTDFEAIKVLDGILIHLGLFGFAVTGLLLYSCQAIVGVKGVVCHHKKSCAFALMLLEEYGNWSVLTTLWWVHSRIGTPQNLPYSICHHGGESLPRKLQRKPPKRTSMIHFIGW
jgi:hypothetical protein